MIRKAATAENNQDVENNKGVEKSASTTNWGHQHYQGRQFAEFDQKLC